MALQDCKIEVKYAQNHKMALSQGLADCQDRDYKGQPNPQSSLVVSLSLPFNHHYLDENVCLDLPKVYVDGCAVMHECQTQAVGIVWSNSTVDEPCNHQLGTKMRQYAEISAVRIALQQAAEMAMEQL